MDEYAWLWVENHLADVCMQLSLSSTSGQSSSSSSTSSPNINLKLHSSVLGTRSSVFQTLLTTDLGAKRKRNDDHMLAISEVFDSVAELVAAESAVKFFYTGKLTCISAREVLFVMQIADRWEASSLLKYVSDFLTGLTDTFPTQDFFSFPEELIKSPAYAAVTAAATVQLVHRFADAYSIITSPLLQSFAGLPLLAVTTLLRNDSFATDAEESVFLLANHWLEEQSKHVTEQQLNELNKCVRYSRLKSPQALGLFGGDYRLPPLTPGEVFGLWDYSNKSPIPCDQKCRECEDFYPAAWYFPARPQPRDYDGIHLTLQVPMESLKEFLSKTNDQNACTSQPVYGAGFLWTLGLRFMDGDLSCVIAAKGVESLTDWTKSVDLVRGVEAYIELQIDALEPYRITCSKMCVPSDWIGVNLPKDADFWLPYTKADQEPSSVSFSAVLNRSLLHE